MKAAVFYGKDNIKVEERPKPKNEERDVLIKVAAAGICGTDIHIYKGEWKVPTPLILGHEFSGTIEEIGERVTKVQTGDRVVAEPNIICGECKYCLTGERNYFCEKLEAIGVTRDGAFAEYVSVPEKNVYVVPDNISLNEAALIEPLACCIRGIDNVQIKTGDTVAIVGAGPIGLILLQLAKISGASLVIQIDMVENRLELAKKIGADYTINIKEQDSVDAVMAITDGYGVDVSIEAVGNPQAIEQAFKLVRRGGRLNIFGVSPQDAVWNLKPFELYDKELTITSSYRSPFTFERAIRLVASERIKLKPLITHQYNLNEIKTALYIAEKKAEGAIKVLIQP